MLNFILYILSTIKKNVGKDVRKLDYSSTVGRNVNSYKHSRKVWQFLTKLNLPYDLAIALFNISPTQAKLCSHKNLYTICVSVLYL